MKLNDFGDTLSKIPLFTNLRLCIIITDKYLRYAYHAFPLLLISLFLSLALPLSKIHTTHAHTYHETMNNICTENFTLPKWFHKICGYKDRLHWNLPYFGPNICKKYNFIYIFPL